MKIEIFVIRKTWFQLIYFIFKWNIFDKLMTFWNEKFSFLFKFKTKFRFWTNCVFSIFDFSMITSSKLIALAILWTNFKFSIKIIVFFNSNSKSSNVNAIFEKLFSIHLSNWNSRWVSISSNWNYKAKFWSSNWRKKSTHVMIKIDMFRSFEFDC